jgi:hypothetical protein
LYNAGIVTKAMIPVMHISKNIAKFQKDEPGKQIYACSKLWCIKWAEVVQDIPIYERVIDEQKLPTADNIQRTSTTCKGFFISVTSGIPYKQQTKILPW